MDYYNVLDQAMELGRRRHPEAPLQHHMAFANSVATLVTGETDDLLDGPSMREHLAREVAKSKGQIGAFSLGEAIAIVEKICYGPLTYEHAIMLVKEGCADDAPGERQRARLLLNAQWSRN